jgi:hypothetical protein
MILSTGELFMSKSSRTLLFCLLLICGLCISLGSAATTDIRLVRYAADGTTILNERVVDYRWMEAHLPVMGDGMNHYYHQGPIFEGDIWNPAEDLNLKDMGAVKGTDLRDLCNLVGGMSEGETVTLRASDGLRRSFPYENVYHPPSRQGPMGITWYNADDGYVPDYYTGLRLIFFADTSTNPEGKNVFGVSDMHEAFSQEYWYFYNGIYPTTTGLSVQSISEIIINSNEEPTGSIIVESTPQGASIYLDDEDTGRYTPSTLTGIETGMYTIRVELEGYEIPDDEWVTVKTDTPAMVRFNLTQEGGSIEISSVPTGARIYCDGEDTGLQTDTVLELIPQGERTITLVKEGYENETITVEVEIDETTFIDIILLPKTDTLNEMGQEENATDVKERSIIQNMTVDKQSDTVQPTASPNITPVTVSTPSIEDEGIISGIISFFTHLWKTFLSAFGNTPEEELPPSKEVEEDVMVIDTERREKEEREPVEKVARNRTGGLSIESYPQGREITLDNKKTEYRTPIVLNGLREGLHSVRLDGEVNQRVWVHPDAIVPVMIDLTGNKRLRTITITSTEYTGKKFTVNGAYPAYTIPATVELEGDHGWITIDSDGLYHSFSIPDSILNGGTFLVQPEERDCVSLLVESEPSGAAIFVDGFLMTNRTPAMIDTLTPGKYQIVLSKPGFLPAVGEVTIRQGTMESAGRVRSLLTPYPSGSLQVNSTPTGQRIYLYGRYTGETTPHTFDHMRIGTYEVTIQGTDGTISRTITILPKTSVECMV